MLTQAQAANERLRRENGEALQRAADAESRERVAQQQTSLADAQTARAEAQTQLTRSQGKLADARRELDGCNGSWNPFRSCGGEQDAARRAQDEVRAAERLDAETRRDVAQARWNACDGETSGCYEERKALNDAQAEVNRHAVAGNPDLIDRYARATGEDPSAVRDRLRSGELTSRDQELLGTYERAREANGGREPELSRPQPDPRLPIRRADCTGDCLDALGTTGTPGDRTAEPLLQNAVYTGEDVGITPTSLTGDVTGDSQAALGGDQGVAAQDFGSDAELTASPGFDADPGASGVTPAAAEVEAAMPALPEAAPVDVSDVPPAAESAPVEPVAPAPAPAPAPTVDT